MAAIAGIGASALLQFVQGLGSSTPTPTTTARPLLTPPKRRVGRITAHGSGGPLKQISGCRGLGSSAIGQDWRLVRASAGDRSRTRTRLYRTRSPRCSRAKLRRPTCGCWCSENTTDANATDAAPQSFEDILQSFGVTPQQFVNDFSAAFKRGSCRTGRASIRPACFSKFSAWVAARCDGLIIRRRFLLRSLFRPSTIKSEPGRFGRPALLRTGCTVRRRETVRIDQTSLPFLRAAACGRAGDRRPSGAR